MEFDIDAFRAVYPQFADVPDAALLFAWQNALMVSGLEKSDAFAAEEKRNMLYMLVCHMITLSQRGTAGAVASATEGSVSVSFSTSPQTGKDSDWYMLTPCGAAYWQLIKARRQGGMWFGGSKCTC